MGFDLSVMQMMMDLKVSQVLKGRSVVEFGHSDIIVPREHIEALYRANKEVNNLNFSADELFRGQEIKKNAAQLFYEQLGFDQYASIDLFDERAKFQIDLNSVYEFKNSDEEHDLLCNLGTSEHVFNPGNTFINAHNFTKLGGLMIHWLPTYGHINHGFYNIHPLLLMEIAQTNDYKIEQITYFDCNNKRNLDFTEHLLSGGTELGMYKADQAFNYTGTENLETERDDRLAIFSKFVNTCINMVNAGYQNRYPIYMTCDMIFCVFRKTSVNPFVIPGQSHLMPHAGQ